MKSRPGVTGQKLMFAGTVSKLARKTLTARGWKMEENYNAKLGID
jgi:hypothetical protein